MDVVTLGIAAAQAKKRYAPVKRQHDVIIIGATEVGVMAAIAAARQSRSVLLVGQNDRVGGNVGYTLTMMDIIYNVSPYVTTGITREYFAKCARANYTQFDRWNRQGGPVKPTWAKQAFDEMVAAEKNITLIRSQTLDSVTKSGTRITSVKISGEDYTPGVIIDATPTGDVIQKTCTFSIGREGTALYGEPAGAGVVVNFTSPGVDPYVTPGVSSSGLLPGLSSRALGATGAADGGVMTAGWRVFGTSVAAEKQPWPTTPPAGYNALKYELMARLWASNPNFYNATDGSYTSAAMTAFLRAFTIYDLSGNSGGVNAPASYVDINSRGYLSSNYPNAEECLEYITATPTRRAEIESNARSYLRGLFYFITQSGDSRVPANLIAGVNSYGRSLIELPEHDGWNPNFYVREGARVVGDYVMKYSDVQVGNGVTDHIGWLCYDFDGHPVRMLVDGGVVKTEGTVATVSANSQYGAPIPIRVLFPKVSECTNLLCPGQPSVSRFTYMAIRAIPTMMVLGEAAGFVAAEAVRQRSTVQSVAVKRVQAMQNLNGLAGVYAAMGNNFSLGQGGVITETGSGAAFAAITSGLRFGLQQTVTTAKSVAAGVDRTMRFTPSLLRSGRYRVVHIYPPANPSEAAGILRASNVGVSIVHADGTSTRVQNQRFPGGNGGFDVLGDFYFGYQPSGGTHYVDLNTSGATSDGVVVAGIIAFFALDDAVKPPA